MTEQSPRLPTTDSVVQTPAPLTAMAPADAVSAEQTPTDMAPSQAQSSAPIEPLDAEAEATADAGGAAKKRIPPQAVVAQLMAAWPQAFFADPRAVKPLAIGTLQQILANRPAELEGFNSHAIRTGLKFYTSRLSYHYGIVHSTHRITLAGEPADEVDDKAREFAKTQIVAIQQQRAARRAAQNPPAEPQEGLPAPAIDAPKPRQRFRRSEPNRTAVEPAEASHAALADADTAAVTDAPRRGTEPSLRAAAPGRSRAPRREPRPAHTGASGDGRAPRAQSAAMSPAPTPQESLSLEEKLARLAQHFGKPS